MTEMAWQLPILGGMLLMCFIGPAIAFGALYLRKARARERRRSPIAIDLLRSPGHALREQLEEANTDVLADVYALMFAPLMVVAVFLAQAQVRTLPRMLPLLPLYVVMVLGVIAWVVRKLIRSGGKLDRLRAGYDAEVAVGQELDQLMRQGAAVFHDFPAENFNIDHIVISRRGVFAVETKGYTKPADIKGKASARVVFDGQSLQFPTWTTREPLEQAERQAQWLTKWLAQAAAERTAVLPVLALPGWFVERAGRGPVRVFSGRELKGLLDSRDTSSLSEDAMQRIVHQVEQRCRNVAPTYAKKS